MSTNTNLRRVSLLFFTLLAGMWSLGCADEFDPPSLIERTRVLGARVEVAGDRQRATPQPGETATVTWLVTAPADLPPLGWAFAICLPSTTEPPCSRVPLAVEQGSGVPSFQVVVPMAEALGTADRLVLLGQICDGAAPIVDEQTRAVRCPGAGTQVTLDVHVQREEANQNPDLTDRSLWFDGMPWPAGDSDCSVLPQVPLSSKGHVLRLRTLATDRELTSTGRETLQISGFDTAGKLDRTFSFVEASDAAVETDVEVKWDAPDVQPANGRVRFTFVVRDLRGGVAWLTRTACAL